MKARLFFVLVLVAMVAFSLSLMAQGAKKGADGKTTFESKCATCHGKDGSGNTPMGKTMKVRDLSSAEVQKMSDADLAKSISAGKGKMAAYKSLGEPAIKELVAYIRTLKK